MPVLCFIFYILLKLLNICFKILKLGQTYTIKISLRSTVLPVKCIQSNMEVLTLHLSTAFTLSCNVIISSFLALGLFLNIFKSQILDYQVIALHWDVESLAIEVFCIANSALGFICGKNLLYDGTF